MGCIKSTENGRDLELSEQGRPRSPEPVVPEKVQGLELSQLPEQQHGVSLTWIPPENMKPPNYVSYYVRVSSKLSSEVVRNIELEGPTTSIELSERDGLKPLQEYIFAVQAMSREHVLGDWNMLEGRINWPCKLPDCETNRLMLEDNNVYSFCSREHKMEFDEHYCLYGDCTERAGYAFSPTPSSAGGRTTPLATPTQQALVRERDHFCCHDHYYRVATKASGVSHGFLLEVERGSQEYRNVEEVFNKKWIGNGRKLKLPTLRLVLAVLNPALQERFDQYKWTHVDKDRKDSKMIKKLFFGTKLGCDLYTYQVPCKNADSLAGCSLCHLALHGFSRLSMKGVMLDKNPAQSHEKASAHEGSLTYGLLLCDVTCANTKKVKRRTMSESEVKPEGFDAVAMRRGSFLKNSTDEVVVYNEDAVCPRYVLLYV